MSATPLRHWFSTLGALTTLGCRQATPPDSQDLTIAVTDTIVSAGNAILDHPSELTVDEHGQLFVTDVGFNAVVVLDSDGVVLRRIGRAGSGPGEMQFPRSVIAARDTLRLLDAGNGRVSVFTTAGTTIRSGTAPEGSMAGPVAFDELGSGVVGVNGQDSALARRFDAAGKLGARLGRQVVPAPPGWNFTAIKQQIRDGHLPAELRNSVLPVLSSSGQVWLLLQSEGTAELYGATNFLLWHVALAEPELVGIRDEFFRRNRADSSGNRLYQLAYFTSAIPVGSELWILVRTPAGVPTLLLVLAADGQVRLRLRIPTAVGVRGFGLSPNRRVLYLLAYDDVAILRVRLPANF